MGKRCTCNCRTGSTCSLLACPGPSVVYQSDQTFTQRATMIALARIVTKNKRQACFISGATTCELSSSLMSWFFDRIELECQL